MSADFSTNRGFVTWTCAVLIRQPCCCEQLVIIPDPGFRAAGRIEKWNPGVRRPPDIGCYYSRHTGPNRTLSFEYITVVLWNDLLLLDAIQVNFVEKIGLLIIATSRSRSCTTCDFSPSRINKLFIKPIIFTLISYTSEFFKASSKKMYVKIWMKIYFCVFNINGVDNANCPTH